MGVNGLTFQTDNPAILATVAYKEDDAFSGFPDEANCSGWIMLPSEQRISPILTVCPKLIKEENKMAKNNK